MGTRARINIINRGQTLVSIYRQFDGYPDGLGQDIADFAAPLAIVNGFTGDKPEANGMGCFAAQLIAKLKTKVGSVYIRDTGDDSQGEEYTYNLADKDGFVEMTVLEGSGTAFGNPGDTEAEMKPLWTGLCSAFDAAKVMSDEAA